MQTPLIEHMGGEDAVRALVDSFYDLMETLPEGAHLRLLHENGGAKLDHGSAAILAVRAA